MRYLRLPFPGRFNTGLLVALILFIAGSAPALQGAVLGSKSVNQWRNLTVTMGRTPEAFLRQDEVRVRFDTGPGQAHFTARLDHERVPTVGYRISTALLRLSDRPGLAMTAERGWRTAAVISGPEWSVLGARLLDQLTPTAAGAGRYYQGLLEDRLLYRASDGSVRSTTMEARPEEISIEARFSMHETLRLLAQSMEQQLSEKHPTNSLFLIIAPNADRFPQPLLLDLAHRRCVWLMPKGSTDPERSLSLVTSPEGLRALLLEGHGLALLKNPLSSAARLADLGIQTLARLPGLPLPRGQPGPVRAAAGMDLVEWERWLDRYTGTRRELGSLELLIDGDQFFPRLFKAMEGATNHIHLESFIFDRDDVAVEMATRLKAHAQTIPTKALIDRMGSLAAGLSPPATPLPADFVAPSTISSYLKKRPEVPLRHFLNPWFSSDHSKLYLVDGTSAWLGGMNIGREYRFEWHDMMVEVQGPVVATLNQSFLRHWAHSGPGGDLAYMATYLRERATAHSSGPIAGGPWMPVRLLPSRTLWKPFCAAVQGSLRKAQSYIYLENPYLFDRRVIRSLVRARHRGVDVRVILPRVNDFKAGARSNLVIANFLLTHGVRVFFYPGMTHVKALLVDDWACVGSGNLNHLSLRLSQEENIATSDPEFAARLKRDLFETDFARSYELTEPLEVNWLDFLADLAAENL